MPSDGREHSFGLLLWILIFVIFPPRRLSVSPDVHQTTRKKQRSRCPAEAFSISTALLPTTQQPCLSTPINKERRRRKVTLLLIRIPSNLPTTPNQKRRPPFWHLPYRTCVADATTSWNGANSTASTSLEKPKENAITVNDATSSRLPITPFASPARARPRNRVNSWRRGILVLRLLPTRTL